MRENTQEKLRRLQNKKKKKLNRKHKIKRKVKFVSFYISFNNHTVFVTKISYLPLYFSGTHMLRTNGFYLLAH